MVKKLLVILLFVGCKSITSTNLSKNSQEYLPPGTKKVGNNLYVDTTNISNFEYLFYMEWMRETYGEKSSYYLEIIPPSLKKFTSYDFSKATDQELTKFYKLSLTDVTLKQALLYTQWRTDRVAQKILIEKKMIITHFDSVTAKNHFTINKYVRGNYKWILKRDTFSTPIYRIIKPKELKFIHEKKDSIALKSVMFKDILKYANGFRNTCEMKKIIPIKKARN